MQDARTTGKIAPIANMVLCKFHHIYSVLPELSVTIETSSLVQNAERKLRELLSRN